MAQTQKCNVYDFDTNEDGYITLIDTPGLLDPRGFKKDDENEQNIVNAVAALGEIHAILLVHKGSDCREDAALGYLIGEFKGLLPKECKDNIVVLFTHTSNKLKIDAIKSLRKMGIPVDKYFAFENDCYAPSSTMRQIYKNDKEFESYKRKSTEQWQQNEVEFLKFTDLISTLIPRKATLMKTLHTKKSVMFQLAYGLADKLVVIAHEERIYNNQRDNLEKCLIHVKGAPQNQVPKYSKNLAKERIEKWVDQSLPGNQKNTICLSCKNVCHDDCQLKIISDDGSTGFRYCTAFTSWGFFFIGSDKCKGCKHGFESHAHRRTKEVKVTEFVPVDDWKVEMIEIKPVVDAAETIKKLTDNAQKAEIEMKDQKRSVESKLKEIVVSRESQLRMITHLFKECESLSMSPINDHFEQYIELVKKAINDDNTSKYSPSAKRSEIASIDKLLQAYRDIKAVALQSPPVLTLGERKYLDLQFKRIEDEEEEMYKEYQKKVEDSRSFFFKK